ncbi:MAG: hypothetical protein NTZ65_03380, partial [Candidatus Berkelbacteria bacterium]|nr:hypothetical protein [Candidatus Berkelbacteria bacterium]
ADGFGKLAILRFATFNCEMLIPEPQNPKEVDEDFEKMMSILKEDHIKRKIMIQTLEYVSNWYTGLLNTKSAKIYIKKNWLFNEKIAKELKSI